MNLSTKFWGFKSLSRIRSLLRVPITEDECTTNQRRMSYAWILIEVEVFKPLPKTILVEDEEAQVHDQTFFMVLVFHFCQKCQVIMHICDESRSTPKNMYAVMDVKKTTASLPPTPKKALLSRQWPMERLV